MPMSHVCRSCGEDLAGIRPGPDPHYGLCVVTCPDCGAASLRVRDPAVDAWRVLRLRLAALFLAAAHAVVLGGLALFASIGALVIGVEGLRRSRIRSEDWAFVAAALAVAPLVAGVWLGVTMPRRRVLARTAVWLALVLTPWAVALAYEVVQSVASIFVDFDWVHPWPRHLGAPQIPPYLTWPAIVLLTTISCAAGELPARFARFLCRTLESALFRWRRNRARLLRSGS